MLFASIKSICDRYLSSFVAILLFCSALPVIRGQNTCQTADNKPGRCIPIKTCTSIIERLERLGGAAADFVRRSHCGTYDNVVYVCCADAAAPTAANNEPPITTGVTGSSRNLAGYNILSETSCGRAGGDKVSFGEEAALSEYPWMALLKSYSDFVCGGTLITNRYILTAAHCFTSRFYIVNGVRLGEHDINSPTDCVGTGRRRRCAPPYEDFGIEKIIMHSEYKKTSLKFDIALIRLDRTVEFKKHIKAICLPLTSELENYSLEYFLVAGWGATENRSSSNVLMKATIPKKDSTVCQEAFPNNVITTENIVCAGGDRRVDTCKGDSGGPLFFPAPTLFVQFGVSSGGNAACGHERNLPSVYTNVASFMQWITNNIEP